MIKQSFRQRSFAKFNYVFLTILSISMLLPFFHIIAGSFSSGNAIMQGRVSLWPVEFTFDNYRAVLFDKNIWRSFGVTVYITVMGTFLNLFFTSLMAYGLSKSNLKGRKIIIIMVLFTMIFSAPLIPSYLVVKSLGMLNTLWALMIPGLISAFNLIIMISFFQNIPQDLFDCAKIDGCGEYRTLWSIVIPLSMPSLSTIGLFYAVAHWNGYFQALLFIRDQSLFPLQVKLRQLIVESDAEQMIQTAALTVQSIEGIKMASIIFATVPILVIYPFIQKHFMKGAMLGSIKG
ncbi:ABC transporter permease [Pontibacillus marinus BH030004 = DSM 16465]|uniref:ABC transporter permease n=2 Tax=Pontibacillus TaxID=289201 RepID=A0A0A5G0E4_9BACI|nr:carbohydrate ABC transporter permease [Pontibacillus marinus]KGX84568.1 ABC transporter permease [Pontibacillus marinus BH030004 = DSM 16465]